MCTITYTEPTLETAKKDIVVYKIVGSLIYKKRTLIDKLLCRKAKLFSCMSQYKEFKYLTGIVHETILDPFNKMQSYLHGYNGYESGRGFYSYANKPSSIFTIVKCVIPKGAKYYLAYDEFAEKYIYTSNKIKIISEI